LENVTIPKISNVLKYIERELDELEREDFTRLKLVQGKKQVQLKIEEAIKEAERKAEFASGRVRQEQKDQDITSNFDVSDDADVVF
jgi:V-type H+-transporting ATPase subunit D